MALVKYNNNSITNVTALGSVPNGAMTLLQTQTASSSASVSFTSNIDSTYPIYMFKLINIHPQTDNVRFGFQVDTGTNTNYNQQITSTVFISQHRENDGDSGLTYQSGDDQANGTSQQDLQAYGSNSNDNDHGESGTLFLFNPSSSVFVKHFLARTNYAEVSDYSIDTCVAGYINTTTAITRGRFTMTSGNIDSGTFKLYGIKDS